MGQPSTSNQIRAVALKEAVASLPIDSYDKLTDFGVASHEESILARAERFASFIEHGIEVDPNA